MSQSQLKIEYPHFLPVGARIPEIREAWSHSQVIVVCGETGSGKTTQLPKLALEMALREDREDAPRRLIGCTQPRRLAAAAMCSRVAAELGCTPGREVGFQVRNENLTTPGVTRIKFMTDGIPLAELRRDPLLKRYSTIIVDEAHERTLNIDFLCGCLKNILAGRRDLRVAISSATLDAARFSEFFGNAPVIEVAGRVHHIDDVFMEPEVDEELADHVARAVRFLGEYDSNGDILVFLPGEREIRDTAETLAGIAFPRTEIMPLYGRMSLSDQSRIFKKSRNRRVVLATNVAETSITIPGIDFVIDSNLVKLSRYNPRTGVQELANERVSQASARQRRGRAGRLSDGVCVHLCSQDDLAAAPAYTDCELTRSALAGVILEMAALDLPPPEKFPFIDAPDPAGIREGRRTLRELGAIDRDGRLTADGRRIAAARLDPALGKMLFAAERFNVLAEALPVIALLGIRPVRERPMEQRTNADNAWKKFADPESDFIGMIRCWRYLFPAEGGRSNTELRKLCKANYLNYQRVREWRSQYLDLAEFFEVKEDVFDPEKVVRQNLHAAILSGVPRRFGIWDQEKKYYRGAGGRCFVIFPGSDLAGKKKAAPQWIFGFSLVETSRLFVRDCAAVSAEIVERAAPQFCVRSWSDPVFNPDTGYVTAREKVTVFGIVVNQGKRVQYAVSHPAEARKIFIMDALVRGGIRSTHPAVRRWLTRLHELRYREVKIRRPGAVVNENLLEEIFNSILPDNVFSVKNLERFLDSGSEPAMWPGNPAVELAEPGAGSGYSAADYPDTLRLGAAVCRLLYHFAPGTAMGADDEEDEDLLPDGIRIRVKAAEREMFSAAAAEFAVPGYLPEKVELLLRALPKNRRQLCNPIHETVDAFIMEIRNRPALKLKGIASALADFLCEWTGGTFQPADFVHVRLPGYLSVTVEVINQDRVIVERFKAGVGENSTALTVPVRHREKAAQVQSGSKPLNGVFPAGDWRNSLSFEGVTGYPALCGTGERKVFLEEGEAVERHADGIVLCCMERNAGLLKMIRRDFRLSNDFKLGVGRMHKDDLWREWSVQGALRKALGGSAAVWQIRDNGAFEKSCSEAVSRWAKEADAIQEALENIGCVWSRINTHIRRMQNRAANSAEDIRSDLEWRFRECFLRDDIAWNRLPAMLKMLEIRAARAFDSPAKDQEKSSLASEWITLRDKAVKGGFDPVYRKNFAEFVHLLDEYLINVFAPEVRTLCKVSPVRLEEKWKAVRFV